MARSHCFSHGFKPSSAGLDDKSFLLEGLILEPRVGPRGLIILEAAGTGQWALGELKQSTGPVHVTIGIPSASRRY